LNIVALHGTIFISKISFSIHEKMNIGGEFVTLDRIGCIQKLFADNGAIMRTSRLRDAGICSKDIQLLLKSEYVLRLKDGYYVWKEQMNNLSEYYVATATIPNATICFLSAASIYGFTTVIPETIHIAIPNVGRAPQKPILPPIELVQHKPAMYQLGRSEIRIESEMLPIYDRERTVCDCFKRRAEIDDETVLEVIRAYMRGKRNTQTLYAYAHKMRIQHRLHPYVEALQ